MICRSCKIYRERLLDHGPVVPNVAPQWRDLRHKLFTNSNELDIIETYHDQDMLQGDAERLVKTRQQASWAKLIVAL